MSVNNLDVLNIAGYKFEPLDDIEDLVPKFQSICDELELKGSVYLSPNGVNFSLAGSKEAVEKYIKLKAHDELTTDGTLSILTSNMNVQAEVRFENMFPLSLSGIEFDSSLTDVEYATATVSFRYDLYSINNLLKNETTYEGVPDNRNA